MTKEKIKKLLEEIRSCEDCTPSSKNTPLVYCGKESNILIISEIPPNDAWVAGLGETWKTSLKVPIDTRRTSAELLRWLEMSVDEADKRFFWLQRANCHFQKGHNRNQAYKHCSEKFIERAISIVDPDLIITLGHTAAKWFFQFRNLHTLVGNESRIVIKGKEYPFFAFFHPSAANRKSIKDHKKKHQGALELAKKIIHVN